MKNLIKTIAIMVLAVSCARETGDEFIPGTTRRYSLSFDSATRTYLSGTGSTRQVSWNSGDGIRYYTEPGQSASASAVVAVIGDNAYVEIPQGRADVLINAVYGASQLYSAASSENCMYVSSPVKNSQNHTAFFKAHLCAAFSDDIENPNLLFHNAAAILKFRSTEAVGKFVIYGNNGEVITGGSNGDLKITYSDGKLAVEPSSTGGTSVTVQTDGRLSDYYVAILPVRFDGGITIDCYDSNLELIATKKTKNTINTVSSSGAVKILDLGNAQDWITNAPPVAIDLGLSVKWAKVNLGATKPEEYGDYFAWGETTPKDEYRWTTYAFEEGTGRTGPFSRYVLDASLGTVDHKTVLDPDDDAAHVILGGDWRMPTKGEVEELMNNCSWSWTTRNGVRGYLVTSKKSGYSGVSIFLPANGMFSNSSVSKTGTEGNYWSASLSADESNFAFSPYFDSSGRNSGNCYRYFGLGIRPVEAAVIPVSGIELQSTLELVIGKTASLTAIVVPSNATYRNLTWESSDESVATVDASGKVTAVALGTATVTAFSADASVTAACEVTVKEPDYNGHEYVDLGLPSGLKWATCNVGASSPEEYGDYFAWGETEPKSYYDRSTYKWCNGSYNSLTKYNTSSYFGSVDNKTVLDAEDDAASVNWKGTWRMPTDAEWIELLTNCTWTWTTQNGKNGLLVTGPNGHSIFLPAAGFRRDSDLYDAGSGGNYLSSSLYTGCPDSAWSVGFYSVSVSESGIGRYFGFSVRPVSE